MADQQDAQSTRVAVGLITFRRPEGLTNVLQGLCKLTFSGPPPELSIIVVDNDPEGPMREIIEKVSKVCPFPIIYEVEKTRGIPAARNRVVQEAARAGVEFLIFIDDDETPTPGWVDAHLKKQRETGAAAIIGPVHPIYETQPPQWIVDGGYFEKKHEDGAELTYGTTANTLCDMRMFLEWGLQFDPSMQLTGGTDTLIFMKLRQRGEKIIWAADAIVEELVPSSRARLGWLLKRRFREGNTLVLSERLSGKSGAHLTARFWSGVLRVLAGVVMLPVSVFKGRGGIYRVLMGIWRGAGIVNSFMGRRFNEYERIQGR